MYYQPFCPSLKAGPSRIHHTTYWPLDFGVQAHHTCLLLDYKKCTSKRCKGERYSFPPYKSQHLLTRTNPPVPTNIYFYLLIPTNIYYYVGRYGSMPNGSMLSVTYFHAKLSNSSQNVLHTNNRTWSQRNSFRAWNLTHYVLHSVQLDVLQQGVSSAHDGPREPCH